MKVKEGPTAAPEEGAVQVHVETPREMPALPPAAAPSAAPPVPPKPIPLLGVAPSILVSERKPSGVAPRAMWLGLHVLGLFLLWVEGAWPSGWPFLVVIATTFVFYSGASFTDPGFVSQQAPHGPGDTLGEMLLAQPVCVHCQAPQPKRAKHCYTCARCVHRLDHHCLWLGNCVGEGNHRLFVAYLAAQSVLLGWAAVASAMTLVTGDAAGFGDDGTVIQTPLPLWRCLAGLGCCALSSLLFLAVLTLVSFQVLLVLRGETTWENLRRAKVQPDLACRCSVIRHLARPHNFRSHSPLVRVDRCRSMKQTSCLLTLVLTTVACGVIFSYFVNVSQIPRALCDGGQHVHYLRKKQRVRL